MSFFNAILYFLVVFGVSLATLVTLAACSITNAIFNAILYFLQLFDVSLVTSVTLVVCSIANEIF